MYVLSTPIPRRKGSVSEQASPMAPENAQSANDLPGCKKSTALEDSIREFLAPIPDNARARIWMSLDLSLYSNSEYVYAIFPIAISLFLGKGGREIAESEPSAMIFAILTHWLNTTATNNYSERIKGQWFCQDTILIGSPPIITSRRLWKIRRWA